MTLDISDNTPALTPEQTLTGWRRELCVELLGEGQARIYMKTVERPSLKATELHRAVLFHRVGAAFTDLTGCVAAARGAFERLAGSAVRQQPSQDNLFAAVTYDRKAWDEVMTAIDDWQRRRHATAV